MYVTFEEIVGVFMFGGMIGSLISYGFLIFTKVPKGKKK